MNADKVILDLCGGTGGWSKFYNEAGYTVHIITLPDYNLSDFWIAGDVIRFRKQVWRRDGGEYLEIPIKSIYGVLAAPPCTMFSIARQVAKVPRDLTGGMITVKACLKIIHDIQETGHWLTFWALENPRGYLRKFMGKPPFTFEHWQFHKESYHCKPTDVWGNYNQPKPIVVTKPTPVHNYDLTWQNPKAPDEYKHLKLDRAAIRAITPVGFAEAFYKANK